MRGIIDVVYVASGVDLCWLVRVGNPRSVDDKLVGDAFSVWYLKVVLKRD